MTLAYFIRLYMQWEGHVSGFDLPFYLSLLQTGTTALYFASKNNHTAVVELLLKSGAQVNKVQHCNIVMLPCTEAITCFQHCIRKTWDGLGTRLCSVAARASKSSMWIASSFLEII